MGLSRVLGWALAASGGIVLSGACSDSNDSPFVPLSRFPQAYAQALCASLRHCCDENRVTFSDPDCTSGWKATVSKLAADPVLASNYDTKIATDCINSVIAAAPASCDPAPGTISAARDVCQQVFVGKKLTGELCTSSAECALIPGLIVGCEGLPIPDPNAGLLPLGAPISTAISTRALPTVRKCIALEPPGTGSSCGTPELQALCERDPNQFCDGKDRLCKARADVGGECSPGGCKVGLFCDRKFCVPGGPVGAACTSAEQCNTFLHCDAGSSKCEDRRRPQEGCSSDEECSIGVCDLATKRCLANAIATSESCRGTDPATARTR